MHAYNCRIWFTVQSDPLGAESMDLQFKHSQRCPTDSQSMRYGAMHSMHGVTRMVFCRFDASLRLILGDVSRYT